MTDSAVPMMVDQRTATLAGYGLTKTFGDPAAGGAVALAGVDITLVAGQAVAVMGQSGSGKSTLLHVLAGIIAPDSGRVLLNGVDLTEMSDAGRTALRRTEFGFVFQFGELLPELPAEENIALPLMLGGMDRRSAVESARRWLSPLGLHGLGHRRPGELSGGQAQRVAIARALVTSPRVVFADEPTGSLDKTAGDETMRLLVDIATRTGAALLVVTHEASVAAHCSSTVTMVDGAMGGSR